MAMGEVGSFTRVLGPSHCAFLTFAAAEADQVTAPGQLTAKELTDLYRIRSINQATKTFGVVGTPLKHSLSPPVHNAAFAALGIDAVYLPFEVANLKDFVRRMVRPGTREFDWNLRGLSITAPYKSAILDELDWIDPPARQIGAVNTVVVRGNSLLGYNTDAPAALMPLRSINLNRHRVAVIGSGGAARAVLWALTRKSANVTVFSHHPNQATLVSEQFGARANGLDDACFDGFELVINATPLGMRGPLVDETPVTAQQLRGARIAYDLVYHPGDTQFLREARRAGCMTINGLPMFLTQAAEQFKLWMGNEAPVEVMTQAARQALAESCLATQRT